MTITLLSTKVDFITDSESVVRSRPSTPSTVRRDSSGEDWSSELRKADHEEPSGDPQFLTCFRVPLGNFPPVILREVVQPIEGTKAGSPQ